MPEAMKGMFLLMSFLGVLMGMVQTYTASSRFSTAFWGGVTVSQAWLTLFWAGRLS